MRGENVGEQKKARGQQPIRSPNQRLEAYAVKLLKLEELQGGEPQPHVGTGRDFPQKRREAVGEKG